MSWPSLVKLDLPTPDPPLKLHAKTKRAISSITQPWIIRFRSDFVQSLNAWHPKWCKSSKSWGQRSRLRRDITCAKIRKIINNSAGDCSISLKFRKDFDHVTFNVLRTFKVNRSKVTAWHNVPASKNAIILARISCRRSNLVKIIPGPSETRYAMFKVIRSNTVIAITPPQTARLRSSLVQSFTTSQAIHCKWSKVKITGSKVNVTS